MCLLLVCAHAFNFNLLLTVLRKSFLGDPEIQFIPRQNIPHRQLLPFSTAAMGDAALMLLTVYLLPDRKGS